MSEINPITPTFLKKMTGTEEHHVKPSKKPNDSAFGIRIYGRNVPIKCTFQTLLWICLGFIVPLDNFPLMWRSHHYR